jgi:protein-disulfide isomerase
VTRVSLRNPVTADDHAQGPATAPVTLVQYGDYECPSCGRAYPILKSVQRQLGSKLRFVFRNMPLTDAHPHAALAAEAAESAGAQGKFWQMHDALYEHQRHLSVETIRSLAENLGLDLARFDADLEAGRFQMRVKRDFTGGIKSGVKATPTFFINGELYDGPWDEESLVSVLRDQV